MDVKAMSLDDLYAEHRRLDAEAGRILNDKFIVHEEIVLKEQAAFRPGLSKLIQVMEPDNADFSSWPTERLKHFVSRLQDALSKKGQD